MGTPPADGDWSPELREYIDRVVADVPELTDEERERVAVPLFGPRPH